MKPFLFLEASFLNVKVEHVHVTTEEGHRAINVSGDYRPGLEEDAKRFRGIIYAQVVNEKIVYGDSSITIEDIPGSFFERGMSKEDIQRILSE